jgi:hypothetical protein
MDDISHKFCLVKRKDMNDVGSTSELTHITEDIRSRLVVQMRDLDSLQQIYLFRYLARPFSRALAGRVFEAFCRRQFQRRIIIEYTPMVRLDDRQSEDDMQRYPQWHSSHSHFEKQDFEIKGRNVKRYGTGSLDVRPSNTFEYDDRNFQEFVPTQFTVSRDHDIKSGLIPLLDECADFPPQSNWRFIFVIPDDVQVLKCPYLRCRRLQELDPLSSQIKLEGEEKEKPLPKKRKRTNAPAEGSAGRLAKVVRVRGKWRD